MLRLLCSAMITFVITRVQATAQETRILPETGTLRVGLGNQNISFRLNPDSSATSRPCPPFFAGLGTIAKPPGQQTG